LLAYVDWRNTKKNKIEKIVINNIFELNEKFMFP